MITGSVAGMTAQGGRGRATRAFDEARAPFLYSYAYTRIPIGPTPGKELLTAYEYLSLIATYGGLALIYHGIRVMSKNADMRSADSERKHAEAMGKHDEAMAESRRREEEGIRRHEESMAALRELIERTR